jgi:hypothetical protein
MAVLVTAIHDFLRVDQDVDGRNKSGHDENCEMTVGHVALLLSTGFAAGVISAIVGGAGLITFPALLATGLPPVTAAATNTVALLPGNLIAAIYDRSQLPAFDRSFVAVLVWSIVGGIIGSALLLLTSQRVLEILIPLLLGFATALFAFAGQLRAWLLMRAGKSGGHKHNWTHDLAASLPASIYGGYFGAGLGVIFLGIMSIWTGGEYRRANAAKNFVVSTNSVVAIIVFVVKGAVAWAPCLTVMTGAILGGMVGARIAQRVPHEVMRVVVVSFGVLITAVMAWRYWL